MNRAMTTALAVMALGAGAVTGEFLSKVPQIHRVLGRLFGRGELVAMVDGRGIFDRESVADEVLGVSSEHTCVNKAVLAQAMFALRGEFDDDRKFARALRANGIWRWQLRGLLTDLFRGDGWLEDKIAPEISVLRDEALHYFEEHQADFVQPLRLRPRHIFLAAPQGSDVIETKRVAVQEIIARLQNGEDFASLAATLSEDEASKGRGGDLGFLAGNRVPAEFWNAIENLPANGPATLVQSHLGFHAVQILEVRPARAMTFEEARLEIEQRLAAEKRLAAVAQKHDKLAREAVLVSR
jgi:PPIC-type PPIASE domain